VERADLILLHSEQTREQFHRFYPAWIPKMGTEIVWFAEWIRDDALRRAELRRPFQDRSIDALFVASDWGRPEKNGKMVEAIALRLPGIRIRVAGRVSRPFRGAGHEGLIADRDRLFALMGNARAVVCPSRFDAAPGVLFEAAAMGCNVVTSKNVGNWPLCHPDLLADPPDAATFANRVRLAIERKYADRSEVFPRPGSYAELLEILRAF
jgi:glycosyltransferase involved in cell wall biosynthesis